MVGSLFSQGVYLQDYRIIAWKHLTDSQKSDFMSESDGCVHLWNLFLCLMAQTDFNVEHNDLSRNTSCLPEQFLQERLINKFVHFLAEG